MNGTPLSRLGFDLTYLAFLTKTRLKRLSRWEGDLAPDQIEGLRDLGLEVARVTRRLRFGRKTHEVIFSRKSYYTDFYVSRFDMTRLKESRENMKLQGFLFGYPSCCIEAFIRDRYAKNGLLPRDQQILFHWACPGCKVTPPLLRDYRDIHAECVKILGAPGQAHAGRAHTGPVHASYTGAPWGKVDPAHVRLALALKRGALPVALGLSALLLVPGLGGSYQASPERWAPDLNADPHLLPVDDDIDVDYLSHAEEVLRGVDPWIPDTDSDGIIDGVEEALFLSGLIEALPESPQPDAPYKVNHWARGLEYCDICGAAINMGFVAIVNPARNLETQVPFIGLHYLEHGSLSYAGSYHTSGRLDLPAVKRILLATDESHLMCDYYHYDEDPDADGLGTREEGIAETDPGIPDTDGDSVKDGPQYVEDLVELISALPREVREDGPYLLEHHAFGLEACETCGAIFNMGFIEITNPLEGITVEMPFNGLHYLAHGSCTYRGTAHAGRTLPTVLRTVLTGTGEAHWLDVDGDSDGDGLRNEEEPHFSLDPGLKDTDGDGLPDGPELATAMARVISGLPEGPLPDATYVIHMHMDGFVYCLTCGERINMGHMEIVNPVAGTSRLVDYVNHHYMEHGSFFCDYPDHYRTDPRDLDLVLDMASRASATGRQPFTPALAVYPNPFSTDINISYDLPGVDEVNVGIYDTAGRQVQVLADSAPSRGKILWDGMDADGRKLPGGVYFCRLKVAGITLSKKIILLD
jgi:hypothetical protein